MRRKTMSNRLKKYHFKDEHGHPLENCIEWIEMVNRIAELERKLKRINILYAERWNDADAFESELMEESEKRNRELRKLLDKWESE